MFRGDRPTIPAIDTRAWMMDELRNITFEAAHFRQGQDCLVRRLLCQSRLLDFGAQSEIPARPVDLCSPAELEQSYLLELAPVGLEFPKG